MQEQKQITLEELRKHIDAVDTLLIKCLAKRQDIVLQIAKIKKQENLPIFCPEREKELMEERVEIGIQCGINPSLIETVFRSILAESKNIQLSEVKNEK